MNRRFRTLGMLVTLTSLLLIYGLAKIPVEQPILKEKAPPGDSIPILFSLDSLAWQWAMVDYDSTDWEDVPHIKIDDRVAEDLTYATDSSDQNQNKFGVVMEFDSLTEEIHFFDYHSLRDVHEYQMPYRIRESIYFRDTEFENYSEENSKGHIEISNSRFNGGFRLFNVHDLDIYNSRFPKSLDLNNTSRGRDNPDTLSLILQHTSFPSLSVGSETIPHLFLYYCKVDTLLFFGHKFLGEVNFDENDIDRLSFQNCVFYQLPRIKGRLPSNLSFTDCNFQLDAIEDKYAKIDFRNTELRDSSRCKLRISHVAVDKFLLPYSHFELVFDSTETFENRTQIYEDIINSCKSNGMVESSKNWDIEYKSFLMRKNFPRIGNLLVKFNVHWWNFGYDKWKILVIWLPLFFLFFLVLNLLLVQGLFLFVYRDEELEKSTFHTQLRKFFKNDMPDFSQPRFRFAYTLFYTSSIYFGLKLKLNALNYSNLWGTFYILLMYGVGSVHLAFALSYILDVY